MQMYFAVIRGDTIGPEYSKVFLQMASEQKGVLLEPNFVRSVAAFKLSIAEGAFRKGADDQTISDPRSKDLTSTNRDLNEKIADARSSLVDLLSLAPRESFMWLGLCELDLINADSLQSALKELEISYSVGPNEGWIAVRRNPIAFILYPYLDRSLQDTVLKEFQTLSTVDVYLPSVAQTLSLRSEEERVKLLAIISYIPLENRKTLSRMLFQLGVDTPVPGVERARRPWE